MELRSTASGERPRESVSPSPTTVEATPMTGLLAEHLATVRMDLWSSMEQLMTLIKQRTEAFQNETSRQLEADLAELRVENRSLRDQLARSHIDAIESRTGGTGDTMPPHTPQSTVGRDRPSLNAAYHVMNGLDAHDTPAPLGGPPALPMDPSNMVEDSDAIGKGVRFAPEAEVKVQPTVMLAPSMTMPVINTASMGQRIWPSGNRSPRPAQHPGSSQLVPPGSPATKEQIPQSSNTLRIPPRWSRTARQEFTKEPSRSKIFGTRPAQKRPSISSDSEGRNSLNLSENLKKAQNIGKQEGVFADAVAMKERVRAAVAKPEYNVADFYWDEGCCQALARHQFFEYITLSVIAFNALWIAIDVDLNDKELLLEAHPVFQVVEHSFCAFFTFEWTVRFLSFKVKRNAARDSWFCFDTALVIIMIMETWVLTLMFLMFGLSQSGGLGNTSVLKLIRLVRLTRMARMAKLLRAVPELIILIKGIAVAARSVFFTLVLLFLIIYVFAIVLRQVTSDTDIGDEYYNSVPAAMSSLLLDGVLPDQSIFLRANGTSHIVLGIFVIIFILLSSLTVMNMLVGVLCEVVSVVSSVEKEQLTVNYVKQRLANMFIDANVDADGSKTISKHEFETMLTNKEAAEIIQDMGVDVIGLVDFADIIFEDDIELSFADFMELVLQLRGSNNCTVKDMVDLRKFVVTELSAVQSKTIEVMCQMLHYDPHKLSGTLGFVPRAETIEVHTEEEAEESHGVVRVTSANRQRFMEMKRASQMPTTALDPVALPETDLPGRVTLA